MFVGLGKLGQSAPAAVAAAAPVKAAPALASRVEAAPETEEVAVPAASIAGAFARKPARRARPVSAPRIVETSEKLETRETTSSQPLPVFEVNTGSENVAQP